MYISNKNLLRDIEAFLSLSRMGESYFGKAAVGNSELVVRLRSGKRVWPETEARIRSFIEVRKLALSKKDAAKAAKMQADASEASA